MPMAFRQEDARMLSRVQMLVAGGFICILAGMVVAADITIRAGRFTVAALVFFAVWCAGAACLFATARMYFRMARGQLPIWLRPKRGDD
jgi:amino acid transporter